MTIAGRKGIEYDAVIFDAGGALVAWDAGAPTRSSDCSAGTALMLRGRQGGQAAVTHDVEGRLFSQVASQHVPLARAAEAVLDQNRRGGWTCPSSALYPHQWLWDSCFVAIGLSRLDPARACAELQTLFRGQWANGMLPHMVFAPGSRDAGSRRLWQSKRCRDAPRDVETSCITQPPLPAVAVWHVSRVLPPAERRAFLEDVFPRLVAYHEWLYRERDIYGHGLVTLIHPWECGLDTTPPWMMALRRMPVPRWVRIVERLRIARAVRFVRRDTRFVPAAQRVRDDDGLRMLVLARRAKRYGFELRHMPPTASLLIEDVAFNAFLVVANKALRRIARELGTTLGTIERRFVDTEDAIAGLWDEETGQYYSRDATTGASLKSPTIAAFMPLWAALPSADRARRLIAQLHTTTAFWPTFPVPSVPVDAPTFDPDRYWQGPVWVNMNWVVVQGLRAYGETAAADALRNRTIAMVDRGAFHEYFSPFDGRGFGASDFSWTAALILDLLAEPALNDT